MGGLKRLWLLAGVAALVASPVSAQLSSLSNPSGSSAPDATKANLAGGNTFTGNQTINSGALVINGNVTGTGINNALGQVSGTSNDSTLFLENTNVLSSIQGRQWTAGSPTSLGFLNFRLGSGLILSTQNPALSIAFQSNGAAVASVGSGGLDLVTGKVLSNNSITIINGSGVLQAAGFPALTGDVTTSAGSLTTALSSATVVSKVAAQALAPASIAATAGITSSGATSGIGYATGAGGTVTQITSRTTGVTLNKACGAITLFSVAGSATSASFTVTDSAVAATDVVVLNQKSGTDKYILSVTNLAAGSFVISSQTTGGTTVEAPVFQFCVVKGVNA